MTEENSIAIELLTILKNECEIKVENITKVADVAKKYLNEDLSNLKELAEKIDKGEVDMSKEEFDLLCSEELKFRENLIVLDGCSEVKSKIDSKFNDYWLGILNNTDSKLYLICDGVEKCSKMIRIGDNFSTKAFKNIGFGKHTYLLGKNEMTRFICDKGVIKGIYWDRQNGIAFDYGFDLESDGYFFNERYSEQFNRVAKIITFVELGDIDVVELERGRNNGKPKNDGKVTNTSEYTVYVVDSSWNQLIIRTTGFAVMGHFRLQSCGINHADRKLIWINAFEKHGYKRQPKASILNN